MMERIPGPAPRGMTKEIASSQPLAGLAFTPPPAGTRTSVVCRKKLGASQVLSAKRSVAQ